MKIFMLIISLLLSFLFPKEKPTAKSWAYQDPDTGTTYTQENPKGIPSDDNLGPAIRLNPDTGNYETSDGKTWPAN